MSINSPKKKCAICTKSPVSDELLSDLQLVYSRGVEKHDEYRKAYGMTLLIIFLIPALWVGFGSPAPGVVSALVGVVLGLFIVIVIAEFIDFLITIRFRSYMRDLVGGVQEKHQLSSNGVLAFLLSKFEFKPDDYRLRWISKLVWQEDGFLELIPRAKESIDSGKICMSCYREQQSVAELPAKHHAVSRGRQQSFEPSAEALICDSHKGVWGNQKNITRGQGYLLAARYIQSSTIQDKAIDHNLRELGDMSVTREGIRQMLINQQGISPWLICDKCSGLLGLSGADKNSARDAATRWFEDRSVPGHMPESSSNSSTLDSLPIEIEEAAQGDVESQFILAMMYEFGQDVEQDIQQAIAWYKRAAEQGHADALEFYLTLSLDKEEETQPTVEQYHRAVAQRERQAAENVIINISRMAHKLMCKHCGEFHGTDKWPVNGDTCAFYNQVEPGKFSLEVNCPHCKENWYVVWDRDPGEIQPLTEIRERNKIHNPEAIKRDIKFGDPGKVSESCCWNCINFSIVRGSRNWCVEDMIEVDRSDLCGYWERREF